VAAHVSGDADVTPEVNELLLTITAAELPAET
jgi:hypothetical protein